jgi:hypothetical protein
VNALTLHAAGLARGGDWRLLDALELVTRVRVESGLAGMVHLRGCPALLGYFDQDGPSLGDEGEVQCAECGGDGEVAAMGNSGREKYVSCPWCDGEGTVDIEDAIEQRQRHCLPSQVNAWRTINGETVESVVVNGGWISVLEATQIVAEYKPLVAKLSAGRVPA